MTWWQKALADLGIDTTKPLAPTWTPTYEPTTYVTTTLGDGSTVQAPVEYYYLADAATAEHLRQLYDPTGVVVETPFSGVGGVNTSPAMMRELQFPNVIDPITGRPLVIVAGLLAVIYTNNLNDEATADTLCKAMLRARGVAI